MLLNSYFLDYKADNKNCVCVCKYWGFGVIVYIYSMQVKTCLLKLHLCIKHQPQ